MATEKLGTISCQRVIPRTLFKRKLLSPELVLVKIKVRFKKKKKFSAALLPLEG